MRWPALLFGLTTAVVAAIVALAVLRVAGPGSGLVGPEAALPILVAIALILVAVLSWRRWETVAWLAIVAAGATVTIDLAAAARSLRTALDAEGWDWLTIIVGLSALSTVGAAAAYASGPRRRLGRWVPWLGVLGIAIVAVATGSAIADDGPILVTDDAPLGATGRVTRSFLVITLGAVALGLLGDARGPWARVTRRVEATEPPPWTLRARVARLGRLAQSFVEEAGPGRERARRAALAERARIARDLHADVVPALRRAVVMAERDADLGRLVEQLRTTLAEVEDLAAVQHAVQLDIGGLVPAIEWLAERTEADSDVVVTIDVDDSASAQPGEPPSDVAAAAFRVVGLTLENVARHAPGSQASVTIRSARDRVEVTVSDDGPGIPPDARAEAQAAGRRGLVDMVTEAVACGAELEIGPGPDGGTRVAFRWSPT